MLLLNASRSRDDRVEACHQFQPGWLAGVVPMNPAGGSMRAPLNGVHGG
jgi:hypothetical protein